MILTIFLNFVAMATAYSLIINKYYILGFSEKIAPLIYIGAAYTSSGKMVEPHLKLGQYSDFVKMSQFPCHGNSSFT